MLIQIHVFVSTKTSSSFSSVGKTKSEIRQQGFKYLLSDSGSGSDSDSHDCDCDINSFGWMLVSFCGDCKLAWIAHFAKRTRARKWNMNGMD